MLVLYRVEVIRLIFGMKWLGSVPFTPGWTLTGAAGTRPNHSSLLHGWRSIVTIDSSRDTRKRTNIDHGIGENGSVTSHQPPCMPRDPGMRGSGGLRYWVSR
jgi:hypothetical protein